MFPGKEKTLVPEGEPPVREAGEALLTHKKGKTFEKEQKYTHEELEEVRANAKYAGLGFYGIHDDDTLRTVLNGGDYDPTSETIPAPEMKKTGKDNHDRFIKILESRNKRMSSESGTQVGNGRTIKGGATGQKRPVLAISNYFNFCQRYQRSVIKPYYDVLRERIMGYLKSHVEYDDEGNKEEEDDIAPEDVRINAMFILTAAMHRADSGRPREKYLQQYPELFRAHMRDLLGKENLGELHNFHLCDPDLECGSVPFTDMSDFELKVNLPSDSSFAICDVTDPNIVVKLTRYIKIYRINFIYFIGGQTHWLNRQLTKCKFGDVLESLGGRKIVFSGYSAGLINLGNSSYITACKNFKYPEDNGLYDDVSDLCDKYGVRIADIDPQCTPNENDVGCAPKECGEPLTTIKYDTLGVSPHVYFPHFVTNYIEFLEDIENDCGDEAKPNIVLTDGMMAYTDESGCTGFIFADPEIGEVLDELANVQEITNSRTYSDVLQSLGDWSVEEKNKDSFQEYGHELLAYCHSRLSIPPEHLIPITEDNGDSSDEDDRARIIPVNNIGGQAGGARSSNVYGAIVGLVIAVAAAFVRR